MPCVSALGFLMIVHEKNEGLNKKKYERRNSNFMSSAFTEYCISCLTRLAQYLFRVKQDTFMVFFFLCDFQTSCSKNA